ncbi:MAG: thioredoxin domain-containing protein [Candidatus Vogelbacteria bacterium]|nr:thioredoxin domain-containing protein [Candidatus Vogelbacteria bacterium]
MSNENKIVAGICLFFFIIIAFLFWKGPSLGQPTTTAVNSDILVKDLSHMTGKKGAKVTVVEFGDYQCPACAAVNPEIKKLTAVYKTNPEFNFVFRNFPLSQHKNAIIAAEAAESAGAQGKYFEMDNLLYENQQEWGESADPKPLLSKYAAGLALDMLKFQTDMTAHTFVPVIQADTNDGQTIGIDHTPTVYINGTEQRDLQFESMKKVVDGLLTK